MSRGLIFFLCFSSWFSLSLSFSPFSKLYTVRYFVGEDSLSRFIDRRKRKPAFLIALRSSVSDDDSKGDDEGMTLAAEFFKAAKGRGIGSIDLDEEDDDDEEIKQMLEDEEEGRDISISEVNIFKKRDEGAVGKLAGNVTFTNKELYNNLKERVLESPAAFQKLVGKGDNDDIPAVGVDYTPPSLYPDSGLTAGEVVTTVLEALKHNDIPSENEGIRVLFGYSSKVSMIKAEEGPTVEEYSDFLKTSEYKVLLEHSSFLIDKADYSRDKKKAYFTVRLRKGIASRDFVPVNFMMSTTGSGENDCWLIDSILIRPEKGRRR